ncbi:MAG: thiol reductase thioredoxin [Ignavibacteria bacterium]|nr:MAG: thiol reductase thioredoxin [Ignavibacteria bacterium]
MKTFIIIFFLIITTSFAQSFKLTEDPKSHKPMLIGNISLEQLKDSSFYWWYNSEYNFYQIDQDALNEIKNNLFEDLRIKIFFGTWCSDSRRELPRFIKILDSLKFNKVNYELIAIDRDKKGLKDETEGWNVELVPTIIFLDKDEELGRIIESPEESLELDFETIIKKKSR